MTTPDDERSRLDELIAAADRVAQRPLPPPRPRTLPAVLLGIGGLVAVIIGINLASGDDDGSVSPAQTTAVPLASTTTVAFTTVPVVITLPPTLPPTVPSTVPTTTVAPTTTAPSVDTTTTTIAGAVEQPVRSIRHEGGIIHLEGAVPDPATADTLFATMAAVVGADHVDTRYQVVPGTPLPASEPMFFPDTFQFAPNSSELAPADFAVLDQVMVFLVQNPQVTLDILAYTDSAGPDDSNLELSQMRATAIWAYLLYGGIDPARVTATGMGEADPVADNATPEGRVQNRRIEFVVHDLLP